ncbi:hypothetical protein CYMTET_40270 [Cymbomonas tetramitiformis]|uniref:Uncharacterized protein n=1 Tax=Cymbomonas tetramitiformis TaxID=36881 RepID=A0AAE0F4S6_9CHLO|nr:hypothetical protein CYMTET_40270 [Cymbomonas tetramitiformis]
MMLVTGYRSTTFMLAVMAGCSIFAPAAAVSSFLAPLSTSPSTRLLLQVLGVCLLPTIASAFSLKDAAENSRLASNTYKRLNLGLLAAGLTVLLNKRTAEAIWLATKVDIPSGFFYATSVFTLMSILTMFCFTEAEEATLAQTPTVLFKGAMDFVLGLFTRTTAVGVIYSMLAVITLASAAFLLVSPIPSILTIKSPLEVSSPTQRSAAQTGRGRTRTCITSIRQQLESTTWIREYR